ERTRIGILQQQRRGVRTESEEGRVAEAHKARLPDQQFEAEREDRQHENLGDQVDLVLAAEKWEETQRDNDRDDQRGLGREARHRHPWRNSPSGFHSRIAAIITYTSTPAASWKNTLPNVSTKPTSNAATNAPRTEPMPPITTTTKQMISTWLPMPGYT